MDSIMNKTSSELYYNPAIKDGFLKENELEYATIEPFKVLFKKSKSREEKLQKDLYDFTLNEIKSFVMDQGKTSVSSVNNMLSNIRIYCNWAIHYAQNNIDEFDGIIVKDIAKDLVVSYKNALYDREEILDMCESLPSAMDAALVLAVFEGIKGRQLHELRALREKDLFEENGEYGVELFDLDQNGEVAPRKLMISKELYQYIKLAAREDSYTMPLGDVTRTQPLANTEYIFRTLRRKSQADANIMVDPSFMSRKFTKMKELLKEKTFKLIDVFHSGLSYEINQFVKDNTLKREDYIEIAKRFKVIPERYRFQEEVNKKQYQEKYGEVEVLL